MSGPEVTDWLRFKEDGDDTARQKLAERYLPLVKTVVDRMAYRLPSNVDREDLVSEGIIGLLDALDKFEPQRMSKFESYAVTRIRGSVLDYLRQSDWAPRSLRQKSREIEQAYTEVERKTGRAAQDDEVAQTLGITVDELHSVLSDVAGAAVISFEELLQVSDGNRPIPMMTRVRDATAEDPGNVVIQQELRVILKDAVERLPETEKLVVSLYYAERLTLKEIGRVLEITESRVCQLHARAVMRLRGMLTDADKARKQAQ